MEVDRPRNTSEQQHDTHNAAHSSWAKRLASPRVLHLALFIAALLRIGHLYAIAKSPLANNAILDHQAYDAWAQRIASGDWVGHEVFWVDPLYSYVLAILYKLFGHHYMLVRVLQSAAGVANVALAGVLAKKITGSCAVGHGAAMIAALYLPLIHNEAQLEKSTLTTLLVTAALVLFLNPSRRSALAAGVLTGLAVLSRGNILLAIPVGTLALLIERSTEKTNSDSLAHFARWAFERESCARAIRFAAASLAVVGVLTVRNVIVAHDFLPTTANGGQNFYIGQWRNNLNGTYKAPPFVRPDPRYEQDDFRVEAERRVGHSMKASEISAFWAREAIAEVIAAPGATFMRTLHKLRLTFHDVEIPDNDDIALAAYWSPVLRLPLFSMGYVVPFALLGAVVAWRSSRKARIVVGATALYLCTLLLFFVVGRFRIPMVPALIALSATGIAWLVVRLNVGDRKRLGKAMLLLAACAFFCFQRPDWLEQQRISSLAIGYNNIGAQLLSENNVEAAIESYERAIATKPEAVVGAMRTLGDLYLQKKKYDDAARVMRMVIEHRPNSRNGRNAIVRLYETMMRDPQYANDVSVRTRLIDAYRAAGRGTEADRIAAGGAMSYEGAARAKQLYAESRAHRVRGDGQRRFLRFKRPFA